MSASDVFGYLADCYRENGSRFGITSLESGRVRRSLVVEGQDVVVSDAVFGGRHFVPGARAADLATQARLHEKDRDLFYGAVFFGGRAEGEETGRKPAFAPVILYGVSVIQVMEGESAGAEFEIDTSRRRLNYALLESLGDEDFLRAVEAAVEEEAHTEGCVGELRRCFRRQLPDLDDSSLLNYPYLLKESEIKNVFTLSKNTNIPRLFSAAALFLANKSTEMRGVLNDLELMAKEAGPSGPVRSLLGETVAAGSGPSGRTGHIPAILSVPQQRIAASARRNPVTLAVGPPGTGKSFTIAALAIEAMSRGESVLVVSKMNHAVDVVADKIEESLGLPGVCVRAGRAHYLKELKEFLDEILSGMHAASEDAGREVRRRERKDLPGIDRRLRKLEELLERRCRREERRGALFSDPAPGVFTRWRQQRIRRRAMKEEPLSHLAAAVTVAIDEKLAVVVETLVRVRSVLLERALARNRPMFQAFSRGIRARTTHKKEEYFSKVNWSGLLEALPVWLVNLSDLHRVIPCERELFDLVIIDEASQCDIASAMPALHRAKRAVVTGDPKQLRHVSFLPVARQAEFAGRHGLGEQERERFDFRKVSLVDLAADAIVEQDRVVFLNEHFRSRPEIIAFSNREFYGNRLAIMTGHREIDRHGGTAANLRVVGGSRDGDGINEAEVDAVLREVDEIANRDGPALAIGILSPFRAQVDAIQKRLEKSGDLNRLLERHDLLVGTAHSFQGEERDVMLLSLALDDASPSVSFRFLEKEDVFNVSITRARLENRVFVSFDAATRGSGLVGRFLHYLENHEKDVAPGEGSGSHDDPAFRRLVEELESRGFETVPDFRLGGHKVDLLCRREGRSLGIDVIGFPGHRGEALEFERYLLFRRAGIPLYPVGLAEWEVRGAEVLAAVDRASSGTRQRFDVP